MSDQDRTIPERPEPDFVPRKPVYDFAKTIAEDEDEGNEKRLRGMTW